MLEIKPHIAYLVLSLFFGIIFVFIIPPFYISDEGAHFYRAYQISNLEIIGERSSNLNGAGGYLPISLTKTKTLAGNATFGISNLFGASFSYSRIGVHKIDLQKIKECLQIKLNPEIKKFVDFRNTVLYPPFSYLPQAIGIEIGKIAHLPPLALLYLARLSALLCSVFLIYYVIKITPVLKWEAFLLALMPMTMYQVSSASYDSLTIGLSLLFSSLFLYYALAKKEINIKNILFIFVMLFLVAQSKHIYFPLVFLYFLIPHEKIGSWRKYLLIFSGLFLMGLFSILIWGLLVAKSYVPIHWIEGINPFQQFLFVLSHPLSFFAAILKSFKEFGMGYLFSFVSIDNVFLFNGVGFRYFLILFLVPFLGGEDEPLLTVKQRCVIAGSFALNFLSVCFILYLSATMVGADYVEGIYGRYFIPFAFLFFLLLQSKFPLKTNIHKFKSLVFIVFSLITLATVTVMIAKKCYL